MLFNGVNNTIKQAKISLFFTKVRFVVNMLIFNELAFLTNGKRLKINEL